MTSPWAVSLFAVFVWWFSTGAILVAVRRADRQGNHKLVVLKGLPILFLGAWCVHASMADVSVSGVFLGFVGALAIWGWIELAFLAGVITGPMQDECPPSINGKERFFRAFSTVAYHELALTIGFCLLVLASDGAENQMAMATYLILFVARISAKLNLFFGVPRINTEFLPQRLMHLKSYFRQGSTTWAFPVAITVLTLLVFVCAERLWTAQNDVTVVGFALLTALSALALLEHWLMVVPLPDAKLWRWMLPSPKTMTKEER